MFSEVVKAQRSARIKYYPFISSTITQNCFIKRFLTQWNLITYKKKGT
jgi:hypothetical protein